MSAAHAVAVEGAPTFGWDVGGAHLKVCAADAAGNVLDVGQWACPLWQGLDHLHRAIDQVFARWPAARGAHAHAHHAVTMTGEMVDLFPSREQGVQRLVEALAERLAPRVHFFGGAAGWLTPAQCAAAWHSIASANWLATASLIATRVPNAVLIDIGSTTTDIVPIAQGAVRARATDDAGRLATGELVYQGVVRTPLCGVAQRIEFNGACVNVMNEWFATTADVYRLSGELDADCDLHPSADDGPKTEAGSRVRIARMIGRDARDASEADWHRFALAWRTLQLREMSENLRRVEAADAVLAAAPLVGAGCGRFLAAALASECARSYIDFDTLIGAGKADAPWRRWAAICAPSVSVALLAVSRRQAAPMPAAHA